MSGTAIGMMDPAYFVGRKEILEWINTTLDLNLTKVEQTASGAVACQLIDILYPGTIPMHKVNFEAKVDYQFVGNYKLLQSAFSSLKIDRFIEVDKLIRAKYQDNLEFMQWFKRYFELNVPMQYEYDPSERRRLAKGGKNAKTLLSSSGTKSTSAKRISTTSSTSASTSTTATNNKTTTSLTGASRRPIASKSGMITHNNKMNKNDVAVDVELTKKFEALSTNHTQLQSVVEGLEKERDFYFAKLAQMEEMLQKVKEEKKDSLGEETNGIVENLFKIMYAESETTTTEGSSSVEVSAE